MRRIALTTIHQHLFVNSTDIVYCESDSNYTKFFLLNGERVTISKTLKHVEELLAGEDFFRVHASYIVNMKHVSKFTRGDGGRVIMSNNHQIAVSKKKKGDFLAKFEKL